MKQLFTALLSTILLGVSGQIKMEDSTAQVITYWSIGDKQSYSISLNKIKLKGTDTTSKELITYDVDVKVLDSTATSYSVEWFYHNHKSNSSTALASKLSSINDEVKVVVEISDLGILKAVKNWKEVRDFVQKGISAIAKDYEKVPNMDKVIKQLTAMYSTKEAIESAAIQDIQQFHSFHGAKYTLGEVLEFPIKVPNLYNVKQPFDSKLTVYLDELNPKDANFIIRSEQEVNTEQLTNVTFEYLKQLAKNMGTEEPKKSEIGQLTNVISTASRLHDSGWLVYSVQTKTTTAEGATNIEERIIEIK